MDTGVHKSLRRQDITFEEKDQSLRDDVRTLGAMVGDLIREQNGDDHDLDVLGHAHGRDDRIEREDDVEHGDLEEYRSEGCGLATGGVGVLDVLDLVVDFAGALEDQEGPAEAEQEYGVTTLSNVPSKQYDAVIVAVAHRQFIDMENEGIRSLLKPQSVLFDIKNVLPRGMADARL